MKPQKPVGKSSMLAAAGCLVLVYVLAMATKRGRLRLSVRRSGNAPE